jgi:hypothetical protein
MVVDLAKDPLPERNKPATEQGMLDSGLCCFSVRVLAGGA